MKKIPAALRICAYLLTLCSLLTLTACFPYPGRVVADDLTTETETEPEVKPPPSDPMPDPHPEVIFTQTPPEVEYVTVGTVFDPFSGNLMERRFDKNNYLCVMEKGLGFTWHYEYNDNKKLERITLYCNGSVISWKSVFDDEGNPIAAYPDQAIVEHNLSDYLEGDYRDYYFKLGRRERKLIRTVEGKDVDVFTAQYDSSDAMVILPNDFYYTQTYSGYTWVDNTYMEIKNRVDNIFVRTALSYVHYAENGSWMDVAFYDQQVEFGMYSSYHHRYKKNHYGGYTVEIGKENANGVWTLWSRTVYDWFGRECRREEYPIFDSSPRFCKVYTTVYNDDGSVAETSYQLFNETQTRLYLTQTYQRTEFFHVSETRYENGGGVIQHISRTEIYDDGTRVTSFFKVADDGTLIKQHEQTLPASVQRMEEMVYAADGTFLEKRVKTVTYDRYHNRITSTFTHDSEKERWYLSAQTVEACVAADEWRPMEYSRFDRYGRPLEQVEYNLYLRSLHTYDRRGFCTVNYYNRNGEEIATKVLNSRGLPLD